MVLWLAVPLCGADKRFNLRPRCKPVATPLFCNIPQMGDTKFKPNMKQSPDSKKREAVRPFNLDI